MLSDGNVWCLMFESGKRYEQKIYICDAYEVRSY